MNTDSNDRSRVEEVACPVCGKTVTLHAAYKRNSSGDDVLVDFGCEMDGMCGITSWDPCPLYVAYREKRRTA